MPQLLDPQQPLTRGWVGPRASLDAFEKKTSCLFQESNHDLSVAYPIPRCRSEITTAS